MRKRDQGQELVEFAIVFPVLMLLLLGVIEFGRIIYSYNAISNAAREGTRLAILPAPATRQELSDAIDLGPTSCAAPGNQIIERVCDRAMALDRGSIEVTVSQPDLDGNGSPDTDIVQIQVVYEGPFLTNLILQAVNEGGLRLQASASMRLE